jgi:hypothetical protein
MDTLNEQSLRKVQNKSRTPTSHVSQKLGGFLESHGRPWGSDQRQLLYAKRVVIDELVMDDDSLTTALLKPMVHRTLRTG